MHDMNDFFVDCLRPTIERQRNDANVVECGENLISDRNHNIYQTDVSWLPPLSNKDPICNLSILYIISNLRQCNNQYQMPDNRGFSFSCLLRQYLPLLFCLPATKPSTTKRFYFFFCWVYVTVSLKTTTLKPITSLRLADRKTDSNNTSWKKACTLADHREMTWKHV